MRWWVAGLVVLAGCRGAAIEVRYLDASDSGSSDGTITTTGASTTDVTTDAIPTSGDDDDDTATTTGPIPTGACPQVHVIQTSAPAARQFDIADLDGNGVDELLAVDTSEVSPGAFVHSIYYLVPTGDAFQAVELAFEIFGEYRGFADIDGDGLRDLLVSFDGEYAMVPLVAAPAFALGEPRTLPPIPRNATFMDANEDGLADFVATEGAATQLLGIGDGSGQFSITATFPFEGAVSLAALDARTPGWYGSLAKSFTDFGCLDAWVVTQGVDPTGLPLPGHATGLGKYDRLLEVVDVNGTGTVDVFVQTCEEPPGSTVGLTLLVSSPEGLLPVLTVGALGWAEAADLDGNGEVDAVFASPVDGTMAYHPLLSGAPAAAIVGGTVELGATAHGHGRFFGDADGAQVLLSYPGAGGTTWAYVSGDPC